MSTLSCAFAVRHRRARGRDELARRIAALERFYAPVGLGGAAFEHRDAISVTIGAIGAIGAAPLASRALFWGAPFGSRPPEANAVLEAGDERLRGDAVGIGLAIAWTDQAARIVTAPAGPTAGYAAESEDFAVWASHAVAAAWLAHGHATVDREAIPELLAFDFVGDGRSLVAGAQPMALATCVDIDAGAAATRSWWPAAERWAPVAESEASAHVERELLRSLERRTAGLGRVGLCLTGGADSRVLAVGLRELGVAVSAVTWGEPGWEDVVAAAAVADALGIDWQQRAAWREDAEIAVRADAEARWSDGAFGVAPADRLWPAGTAAVMVGAAGEVGRAFYYRRLADRDPPADGGRDEDRGMDDQGDRERRIGRDADRLADLDRGELERPEVRRAGRHGARQRDPGREQRRLADRQLDPDRLADGRPGQDRDGPRQGADDECLGQGSRTTRDRESALE